MLAALKVIKVNGVPVFNTTQAKSVLNPIESKLNNKLLSLDEKKDSKAGRILAERVVSAFSNLKNIEERAQLSATTEEEIKDAVVTLNPKLSEEEVESLVDGLFDGSAAPIQIFNQRLRELANDNDEASRLYYGEAAPKIREGYAEQLNFPVDAVPMTSENKKRAVELFESWWDKNRKDYKEFLKSEPSFRAFPELIKKSSELMAGEYVKDKPVYTRIKERLTSELKLVDDKYEDNDFEVDYGNFLNVAFPAIHRSLVEKARELSGSEYDETRDETLQRLADTLLKEETERYQGIVIAKGVSFDIEPITEKQKERLKPSKETGLRLKGDIKYPSLDETKTRKRQSTYKAGRLAKASYTTAKIDRKLINEERALMIENRDITDLKLSLTRFGFEQYSPDSARILERAALDFMDVKLLGNNQELQDLIGRWDPVLQKDLKNEVLTADEKEIRDEFQAFGVFDDETILQFSSSQETFLND
jgi:hypothetical protein